MHRTRSRAARLAGTAGAALLMTLVLPALPVVQAGEDPPYTVECDEGSSSGTECRVDKKTYIGWRTYHAFCHVCHAQDAVGSSFAPSLLDRMKDIDKARYLKSLNEGYTGQVGVMPGWKDNPNVSKRYEELYAYLRARSDGVLPPGRPTRKR